ncbi:hypothetical protein D3C80_1670600 [compost metagenome]
MDCSLAHRLYLHKKTGEPSGSPVRHSYRLLHSLDEVAASVFVAAVRIIAFSGIRLVRNVLGQIRQG